MAPASFAFWSSPESANEVIAMIGVAAIDAESDVIRVELADKPASATYDPLTLTVSWTPTRADLPSATFLVRLIETDRNTSRRRVFEHRVRIDVTRARQPVPAAVSLGPEVEALLTVRQPERLRAVRWRRRSARRRRTRTSTAT